MEAAILPPAVRLVSRFSFDYGSSMMVAIAPWIIPSSRVSGVCCDELNEDRKCRRAWQTMLQSGVL
jgi:hypothetical protein